MNGTCVSWEVYFTHWCQKKLHYSNKFSLKNAIFHPHINLWPCKVISIGMRVFFTSCSQNSHILPLLVEKVSLTFSMVHFDYGFHPSWRGCFPAMYSALIISPLMRESCPYKGSVLLWLAGSHWTNWTFHAGNELFIHGFDDGNRWFQALQMSVPNVYARI